MEELDKKLFGIIKHASNEDGYVEDSVAVREVARIKQAFVDAGWLSPERVAETQKLVNKLVQNAQDMHKLAMGVYPQLLPNVMTGQEWYDRFEKEMDRISAYATFDNHDDVDRAMDAAKRASGIES